MRYIPIDSRGSWPTKTTSNTVRPVRSPYIQRGSLFSSYLILIYSATPCNRIILGDCHRVYRWSKWHHAWASATNLDSICILASRCKYIVMTMTFTPLSRIYTTLLRFLLVRSRIMCEKGIPSIEVYRGVYVRDGILSPSPRTDVRCSRFHRMTRQRIRDARALSDWCTYIQSIAFSSHATITKTTTCQYRIFCTQ